MTSIDTNPVITEEDILTLERLEKEAGVACVRAILHYLRRGEFVDAQTVRRVEGDKTRVYPAIEKQLLVMFGCRLHGEHGCTHWLCKNG
jgi:hypothetical protein